MKTNIEAVAIQIIVSIGATMILGGIALLANDQIRGVYWLIAMLISIISSYWLTAKNGKIKNMIITNILFLVIMFIAITAVGKVYDTSWDGQTYHQEAVIVLKEGWNPIYDEERPEYTESEDEVDKINMWVNHYAKGNWYYGAALYDLFENIKVVKVYNVLLMVSLFFMAYVFFCSKVKLYWSILLTLAITLNPVAVSQLLTNYNDGQIALLLSLMMLFVLKYDETKQKKYYTMVGLLIVVMASVKFTALAYAMLLAAVPFALVIYKQLFEEKNRNVKELIVKLLKIKELKTYVIAILIGVLLVGAGSYVKNTVEHGHPFYPLSGEGKVDIMSYNTPLAIQEKPLYEQFYLSIFGEMTNDREKEEVALKFPLSIHEEEEKYLGSIDLRIGGFGPYFGFVVILFVLMLVAWRESIFRKENKLELIIVALILVSIVINPEIWWARYIPQLWLIPLLTGYMVLKEKGNIKKAVNFIMLMAMIVSSSFMLTKSLEKNYIETSILNEQMDMLRAYDKEIGVNYATMRSSRVVFEQNAVEYKEVQACEHVIYLKASTTKICIQNEKDYTELKEKNTEIQKKYEKKEAIE